MDAPIRICMVTFQALFTLGRDIPVGKVTNIKPYTEGQFDFIVNDFLDYMWSRPVNYTITIASSLGTDGCQGLVARNQSDVVFGIVDFPINEEYEKVNPVITFMEEPLVILQAYNRTRHNEKLADIVKQSFDSFSISLWMSIVCFVLVLGIMFGIREKLLEMGENEDDEEDSYPPIFYAFVCFIQHDSKDFFDLTRRILTLVLSVSSFIIITGYFCNLMATDMVVVDKPKVMSSYDDIIERPGVTVLFVKQATDYEHFRNADKDSKEYKLWKVMTTERSNENETLVNAQGFETIILKFIETAHGQHAIIISKLYEDVIRRANCQGKHLMGTFPDLLSYAAVHHDSPVYGKGMIFRQANIPILKTVAKRLRRTVEFGLITALKRTGSKAGLFKHYMGDRKIDLDDFQDCMSPRLVVERPGYQAARLGNFKSLQIFLLVSFVISLYVLSLEMIWFYWN